MPKWQFPERTGIREVFMSRKILIVIAAVAAVATSAIVAQSAKAGSCTVVVAEGRGATEAKASARALKHLTFKTNRWAKKNVYSSVGIGKSSKVCAEKGVLVHCTASHRVCG
jgi:hypothetical protein